MTGCMEMLYGIGLCGEGEAEAAEALLRATLGVFMHSSGVADYARFMCMMGLARCRQERGDLAEAEAHLASARATARAATGARLPAGNADGQATRSRQSLNGLLPIAHIPGLKRDNTLYDLGFDASWEIDFWGGKRSAATAATARADESAARAQGVRLQVVRDYTGLRTAEARRESLATEAALLDESATLAARRFTAGETARDPALAADQRRDAVAAAQATIAAQIRSLTAALAVRTGRSVV